jgi:predicted PhzF superfamily epimerase YddE/YHI9
VTAWAVPSGSGSITATYSIDWLALPVPAAHNRVMSYSTTQAAEILGCHRVTVQRIAQRLNLGTRIRAAIVLSEEDIEAIRPNLRAPGNPQMVAGNKVWAGKKKAPKKVRKSTKK